jgi:hypothetical protein
MKADSAAFLFGMHWFHKHSNADMLLKFLKKLK